MAILAFPNPIYQPAMRIVTAMTNSNPIVVTTSFSHLYLSGLIVRIDIPKGFGMLQMNQKFGPITVINDTQFTLPIDSTYFDLFVIPTQFPESFQHAQAVPFAEVNDQLKQAVRNTLPHTV